MSQTSWCYCYICKVYHIQNLHTIEGIHHVFDWWLQFINSYMKIWTLNTNGIQWCFNDEWLSFIYIIFRERAKECESERERPLNYTVLNKEWHSLNCLRSARSFSMWVGHNQQVILTARAKLLDINTKCSCPVYFAPLRRLYTHTPYIHGTTLSVM